MIGGNIAETWSIFGVADRWSDLVRPQIDAIHTIGGDAIRLMGHPNAVVSGTISLTTYLDRWSQLIAYCADAGMQVYPCGYAGYLRGGLSVAQLLSVLEPWVDRLEALRATHANIYGIDICNEPIYQSGASVSEASQLYARLKSRTALPLTFSDYKTSQGGSPWLIAAEFAPYVSAGVCDLFDFHNYGTSGASSAAFATIAAQHPGKRIVIGEYGTPSTETEANRVAHITRSLAMAQHASCDGAFVWSIFDYDTVPANRYGMFRGRGKPPHCAMAAALENGIANLSPLAWDAFDGPAGASLSSRPANVGEWESTTILLDGNGGLGSVAGTARLANVTAADCTATLQFRVSSPASGANVGVLLRADASGQNALLFRCRAESGMTCKWEIYRSTNGVWSFPVTVAATLVSGSTYRLRAEINGAVATIASQKDAAAYVTHGTFTDPSPLPAGRVDLWNFPGTGFVVEDFLLQANG